MNKPIVDVSIFKVRFAMEAIPYVHNAAIRATRGGNKAALKSPSLKK